VEGDEGATTIGRRELFATVEQQIVRRPMGREGSDRTLPAQTPAAFRVATIAGARTTAGCRSSTPPAGPRPSDAAVLRPEDWRPAQARGQAVLESSSPHAMAKRPNWIDGDAVSADAGITLRANTCPGCAS
jgi:hypothetical protein